MPVILPLVLQSVWPACLLCGPPQGLPGHPLAPSSWPPLLIPRAPEFCSIFLPCGLSPSAVLQLHIFPMVLAAKFSQHAPNHLVPPFLLKSLYPPGWCFTWVHLKFNQSFSYPLFLLFFCLFSSSDIFCWPSPTSLSFEFLCIPELNDSDLVVFEVTGELVTLSPFCLMFIWGAAPSPCLNSSCYHYQRMSLCLMTEPLSGWRRLSG